MTVSGFWPFVRARCAGALRSATLADLRGQRVVLDTNVYLMSLKTQGDVADRVVALHRSLKAAGVAATFVLDGVHKASKAHEANRRRQSVERSAEIAAQRDAALELWRSLRGDVGAFLSAVPTLPSIVQSDVERHTRRPGQGPAGWQLPGAPDADAAAPVFEAATFVEDVAGRIVRGSAPPFVTADELESVRAGLVDEGAAVVVADGDAEALGAAMVARGDADALATDDGDGLVFGARAVVRNLTRPDSLQVVSLDGLLAAMGMSSLSELQHVAVLCGTDYTLSRGIPGVGPANACRLIRKHKTIDVYLASDDWARHRAKLDASDRPTHRGFSLEDFDYKAALAVFESCDGAAAHAAALADARQRQ